MTDSPKLLYVFVQYGTYAGEFWHRKDLPYIYLSGPDMAEACRRLTKTMLSLMPATRFPDAVLSPSLSMGEAQSDIWPLIDRLATDEDRSVTWPKYPDPTGYKARNDHFKR